MPTALTIETKMIAPIQVDVNIVSSSNLFCDDKACCKRYSRNNQSQHKLVVKNAYCKARNANLFQPVSNSFQHVAL